MNKIGCNWNIPQLKNWFIFP